MAESIIIVGPQGCGKSLNAKALAQAYGLKHWVHADRGMVPKEDHLIFANAAPRAVGLKVIQFADAIKKVAKPHPATPKLTTDKQKQKPKEMMIKLHTVLAELAKSKPEGLTFKEMLEVAGFGSTAADQRTVLAAAGKAGLERNLVRKGGVSLNVFMPVKPRRPALLGIAQKIKRERPELSDAQCICEAKAQLTVTNAGGKRSDD